MVAVLFARSIDTAADLLKEGNIPVAIQEDISGGQSLYLVERLMNMIDWGMRDSNDGRGETDSIPRERGGMNFTRHLGQVYVRRRADRAE